MATPRTPTNHQSYCFDDLDDGVVLRVMSHLHPLPDRFNSSRCCKRLHTLNNDPRLWLTVTPTGACPAAQGTPTHATLAEAVAASRPGDTIQLLPGVHDVQGVSVTWPLTIRGAGSTPEHTVLRCPRGADFAIDFFASSRMLNVAVVSVRSPAVVHSAGRLLLERCMLRCLTEGLDHLLTPLHTRATAAVACGTSGNSRNARTITSNSMDTRAAVAALRASLQAVRDKGAVAAAPPPGTAAGDDASGCVEDGSVVAAGAGRLQVAECMLQGGLRAVRCAGSGSVSNVRVIQQSSATLYWLEVDSGAAPAGPPTPLALPCHRTLCVAQREGCDQGLEARAACHECVRRARLTRLA